MEPGLASGVLASFVLSDLAEGPVRCSTALTMEIVPDILAPCLP
jgi:hypothetical protein